MNEASLFSLLAPKWSDIYRALASEPCRVIIYDSLTHLDNGFPSAGYINTSVFIGQPVYFLYKKKKHLGFIIVLNNSFTKVPGLGIFFTAYIKDFRQNLLHIQNLNIYMERASESSNGYAKYKLKNKNEVRGSAVPVIISLE